MIDVKTADRELQTYIRPQTFPVAIRMLRPDEPIPERARRPARDFKKLSMNCQVIDMARRYGWTLVLTREDSICSLGIAALGFEKPTHLHNSGTLCEGMYTETKEAGQRSETAIDRFKEGEYGALLVAPLDRATFEPDLVCVYANPAQVMRLTQAALWKRGGKLASAFGARVVCADIIVTTMRTDRPQVILPCSGARLPHRGVVRRHARRAVDRGVLHERPEGHHGHDELLRALPARRRARVQRSGQRSGGLRLPREILRLRRAVDRRARPHRGQVRTGQADHARPVQDRAAAGLPRAVRGAREGKAAGGHR